MSDAPDPMNLACPAPRPGGDTVQLAHGGGGRRMKELVDEVFLARLGRADGPLHDAAVLDAGGGRLAFTTDGYVVSPLVFPGGTIGSLAVFGTVNDLAMAGASPRALAASFLLEEGFPIPDLERIVDSMARAAAACGVRVVTGDTKVVNRGKGDGVFVTTSGVGVIPAGVEIHPGRCEPGDVVLVTGDVGRHGMAIMSVREGLEFEGDLESDCAPLHELVADLLAAGVDLRCARDLTRGGLASALHEIAAGAGREIELREGGVPVHDAVRGACEILGLDPLHVACEGRAVLVVPAEHEREAMRVLTDHRAAAGAAAVGRVLEATTGAVYVHSPLGGARRLPYLAGEQLPRIC